MYTHCAGFTQLYHAHLSNLLLPATAGRFLLRLLDLLLHTCTLVFPLPPVRDFLLTATELCTHAVRFRAT